MVDAESSGSSRSGLWLRGAALRKCVGELMSLDGRRSIDDKMVADVPSCRERTTSDRPPGHLPHTLHPSPNLTLNRDHHLTLTLISPYRSGGGETICPARFDHSGPVDGAAIQRMLLKYSVEQVPPPCERR